MKKTGLRRDTIDKFYTSEATVQRVVALVREYVDINTSDVILEPSAGSGAFLQSLKELSGNVVAMDVAPEHEEVTLCDFFEWQPPPHTTIHVVGNPLFGRQSSTAIRFIKRCATFATSISFILPRSFKKSSMQRCFPSHFHLLHSEDTPVNSFIVDNREHDVPCVIQIWKRCDTPRESPPLPSPRNFRFVRRDEQPHIAVRRVGVRAGAIHTTIDDKSTSSHYFLRFDDDTNVDTLIEKLRDVTFDHNNTVAARSISKPELIHLFNSVLE